MDVTTQLDVLNNGIFSDGKLPLFKEKLKEVNIPDIKKGQLKILQLNIGYMCNQTCSHCHVDAGPNRKDMMSVKVLKRNGQYQEINFDKVDHPNGPCFAVVASKFDLSYYLDPNVNPDLNVAFGKLPYEKKRLAAIEHFNIYGRKEGRLAVRPS